MNGSAPPKTQTVTCECGRCSVSAPAWVTVGAWRCWTCGGTPPPPKLRLVGEMHPVTYQVLVDSLDQLSADQTLELHRELSRRAQAVRSADPTWRAHQHEGVTIHQDMLAARKGWTRNDQT